MREIDFGYQEKKSMVALKVAQLLGLWLSNGTCQQRSTGEINMQGI